MVRDSSQVASKSGKYEIDFDDIAKLVHADPSLSVLRETFKRRITYDDVLNRRKKTMAGCWFFDYTHYNRHKDGVQKKETSTPTSKRSTESPMDSDSKRRRIIPKKHFDE
jgi:hypothetical protein